MTGGEFKAAVTGKARPRRSTGSAETIAPVFPWNSSAGRFPRGLLAAILQATTKTNDIVLDPLSNCGETAVEILRAGRRAALIEINPVAAFFAEVNLRPVSLPLLRWAYADARAACAAETAALFSTACPDCGKAATGLRYFRRNGKIVRIEYACECSPTRLVKKPDGHDEQAEAGLGRLEIPHGHPARLPDPAGSIRQRTVAALAILLHAVENLPEQTTRDVLKTAFAIGLQAVYYSHSRSAVKTDTVEENPRLAFEIAFHRVYDAKKTGNQTLKHVEIGRTFADLESGRANVVILDRASASAAGAELPEASADAIICALPAPAGEPGLTAIQAAWLQLDLDREWDVVPEPGDKGAAPINARMLAAFRAIRTAGKADSKAYLFLPNRSPIDLHELIQHMERNRISPATVRYQPATDDFDLRAAGSVLQPGGYLLTAEILPRGSTDAAPVAEETLRGKLAAAARLRFATHGSKTTRDHILHAFFQQLKSPELASVSKYSIEDLLQKAVAPFAGWKNGKLTIRKGAVRSAGKNKLPEEWRRIIRDAETLAGDDPAEANAARAAALEALSHTGGTAEDAGLIRGRIRAAEIVRRRRERTKALLQIWGKALGHPGRAVNKPSAGVIWKISAGRTVSFRLNRNSVSVSSSDQKNNRSEWGSLSYLTLELQAQRWFQAQPERKLPTRGGWSPLAHLPAAEPVAALRKTSPAKDLRLKVIQNREICGRHYLMTVELPQGEGMDFLPGQFFHILCDPHAVRGGSHPLTLRRPLSIHRVGYPGFRHSALAQADDLPRELREALVRRPARIDFLYRVVGAGTEILRRTPRGAFLAGIGPIGNGFDTSGAQTAVIVAGGIGIAPLAALAEALRLEGKNVLVYVGAAGGEMLNLAVTRGVSGDEEDRGLRAAVESEFSEIGARLLGVCTDDGSVGEKALVTELLEQGLRNGCVPRADVRIYACGPAAMLRAVADIAARYGLDCQVSLEERMACGIGACYACTVPVAGPDGAIVRKRVCHDGPVFHARDIQWKV
jgi:dihydroorotate dehydrogenase electron transfer subunit